MKEPAPSSTGRRSLRSLALLTIFGLLSMFITPALIVRADIVQNDVVASGNGTITVGGSTTINYTLINQNTGAGDTVNNCNTAGAGQVFYTINVPTNVTANGVVGGPGATLQIEFPGCGSPIAVTFTSNTAGSYPINGTPSGTGVLVDHADFTLTVNSALPTNTAPTLGLPANITAEATSASGAVVTYTATANDNQDGALTPNCNPASGATFALGGTTVNCSVTDSGGLTTSGSFTVTVQDTAAPSLNLPGNQTVEATSANGATVNYTASASDLVDGSVSVSCGPASGSTFALGTTTVNCSATDAHSNTASGSFTVTVQDSTGPVVNVPTNMTAEATSGSGAAVTFTATATDVVDGDRPVTCSPASGSTFPLGTTTVNCSASDAQGNQGSASFTITVQDTTKPVLSLPTDIVEEATGASGAVVTYSATASDTVDGPVAVTCSPASESTFGLGATIVNCSATDVAGNTVTGSFTVTVRDTTPPAVSVPADITKEATSSAGAVATFSASASDLVDGAVSVSCTPASGSTFPLGTNEVTCSATDAHLNTGTAKFNVIVQDTTPPALTVPANITAEATGPGGAAVTFTVSATDLVDGAVPPDCGDNASGDTFPLGTTTVSCTATDAHDNQSASKSFTVTVQDTTAPSLTLPSNITEEATSAAGAAVSYTASASDLVDGSVAVSCSPASGSTFALGSTTVNCSASDAHGNTASGSFTITVQDTTAPVIAQPQNITVNATSINGAVVNYTSPSTSDAVDGAGTATCLPASGSNFAFGPNTVKCNATDAHGNQATEVTFTVTVANLAKFGFYQPVDMTTGSTIVWNTVKGGSTVPLKFEVFLSTGGNEVTATAVVKSFTYSSLTCGTGSAPTDEIEVLSTGGTSLRYDSTGGQFIQNWKTPTAAGCYRVTLTLTDNSTIQAHFNIRK